MNFTCGALRCCWRPTSTVRSPRALVSLHPRKDFSGNESCTRTPSLRFRFDRFAVNEPCLVPGIGQDVDAPTIRYVSEQRSAMVRPFHEPPVARWRRAASPSCAYGEIGLTYDSDPCHPGRAMENRRVPAGTWRSLSWNTNFERLCRLVHARGRTGVYAFVVLATAMVMCRGCASRLYARDLASRRGTEHGHASVRPRQAGTFIGTDGQPGTSPAQGTVLGASRPSRCCRSGAGCEIGASVSRLCTLARVTESAGIKRYEIGLLQRNR